MRAGANRQGIELICPAGNLPALKAAVDHGADAVYLGLQDATNARHFPGLNFDDKRLAEGIGYARTRGVRVLFAVNTYPQPAGWAQWTRAVDRAGESGADALILADIGLMDYACTRWPQMPLHLSVQASATNPEALRFYSEHFGVRRAVLPRVLSLQQIERVSADSPVEVEVFGFGSLCVMAEGRCLLSSYVAGQSPNTCGACSPAQAVAWRETPQGLESRLGRVLTDRYAAGEAAGYPTICKGRYRVGGRTYYTLEEPSSLNTLQLLPELAAAGVAAIKIEGRQRSAAYVREVTRVWRSALDRLARDEIAFRADPQWQATLDGLSEGVQTTFGPYHRPWQ